jgi:hypothetical protein
MFVSRGRSTHSPLNHGKEKLRFARWVPRYMARMKWKGLYRVKGSRGEESGRKMVKVALGWLVGWLDMLILMNHERAW